MSKHRSVSQRLKCAKSSEAKLAVMTKWSNSWKVEQTQLISELGKAIAADNFDDMCIALGQLKAVSAKKFEALPKVLTTLVNNANANVDAK